MASGKTLTQFSTFAGSFNLDCLTGRVLDTGTRSVTTVQGGTNSGVSSTTTTYTRIFLLDETGQERSVTLQDLDVASRPGNVLSVLSVFKQGKTTGWSMAVYNHDTREMTWAGDRLRDIHGRRRIWHVCAWGIAALGFLRGFGEYGLVGGLGFSLLGFCIGAILGFIAGNIVSRNSAAAFKTGPVMQQVREALARIDLSPFRDGAPGTPHIRPVAAGSGGT